MINLKKASDDGGIHQDYFKAFEWYRIAAEQGYFSAQTAPGCLCRDGIGTARDLDKARDPYFQDEE